MNAKEFDMFMAMMLSMLENGRVDEVIQIIKESRGETKDKPKAEKKDGK